MPAQHESDFRDGLPFLGGALWIDLLNTTPVLEGEPVDLIGDPARLANWMRLAQGFEDAPGPTAADVLAVSALRETLRGAFHAMASGKGAGTEALSAVNRLLGSVCIRRELVMRAGAAELVENRETSANPLAARAAEDFALFLIGHEPARLKRCANPACTMVFCDRGKNCRRRWCSADVCGNRDKVANYRARRARTLP